MYSLGFFRPRQFCRQRQRECAISNKRTWLLRLLDGASPGGQSRLRWEQQGRPDDRLLTRSARETNRTRPSGRGHLQCRKMNEGRINNELFWFHDCSARTF